MSDWLNSVVKALNTPIEWPKSDADSAGKNKGQALPDMDGLEQKGMMGKFFRHWKNPAFLKQLRAIVARMQAEGVNVKDKDAVQAWLKAHEKEIESGEIANAPAVAAGTPYVKTGPDIGRNDPCTCGSGKKYKKCCGGK